MFCSIFQRRCHMASKRVREKKKYRCQKNIQKRAWSKCRIKNHRRFPYNSNGARKTRIPSYNTFCTVGFRGGQRYPIISRIRGFQRACARRLVSQAIRLIMSSATNTLYTKRARTTLVVMGRFFFFSFVRFIICPSTLKPIRMS